VPKRNVKHLVQCHERTLEIENYEGVNINQQRQILIFDVYYNAYHNERSYLKLSHCFSYV